MTVDDLWGGVRGQRRPGRRVGGQRRQAEPGEHGLAGLRDEQVTRPNVPVHGLVLVRSDKRTRDDHTDPQYIRDGQRTRLAHPVGERATFYEVGHDIGPAVIGQSPRVYGRDVRVPRQVPDAGARLFEPFQDSSLAAGTDRAWTATRRSSPEWCAR